MKYTFTLIVAISIVGFGLANAFSHKAIRNDRQGVLLRFESPNSRMNPDLLKLIAGEFRGLVADYFLLEVGSFLGSNQAADRQDWHNIYKMLKLALALDPYFQQTYIYAQGQLPWQGRMPRETVELLEISRDHRPWDWYPGQYIGFDAYYFFSDYAAASEAFLRASKIKGAPSLLAALGARFAIQGQRTVAAIALLQDKLRDEDLDEYQKESIKNRLVALQAILRLEQALTAYNKKHGTYPLSLDDLISDGIMERIPPNPYGDRFFYNPENGQVTFDKIKPKKADRVYQ